MPRATLASGLHALRIEVYTPAGLLIELAEEVAEAFAPSCVFLPWGECSGAAVRGYDKTVASPVDWTFHASCFRERAFGIKRRHFSILFC